MGWTREKYQRVEIEVGDEPLGIVKHMVEEFSRCYRADVGRRPQLIEFVHALDLALTDGETRWHFDDLHFSPANGLRHVESFIQAAALNIIGYILS